MNQPFMPPKLAFAPPATFAPPRPASEKIVHLPRLLDGRAAIQAEPLAALAFERAITGAHWLVRAQRKNGAFHYFYEPGRDRYAPTREYNEVRHAGATYSLWQLYEASIIAGRPDEAIRAAAEAGCAWIEAKTMHVGRFGRAFVRKGKLKLGGQALALVALLERRRVTGDKGRDNLIREFARFMMNMEVEGEPGRFYHYWFAEKDELRFDPPCHFYPGESLLAMTRMAAQNFPGGDWDAAAKRTADYLVYSRDGNMPETRQIARQDHWLTIALSDLYKLHPDEGYAVAAYLQAEDMIGKQRGPSCPHPAKIGAPDRDPLNFCSIATKSEAMVAAWALAQHRGDAPATTRFAEGARRAAQFQLRVQFTPETAGVFRHPERLYGGWGGGPANPLIQIDYVQHNISALIGLWHCTRSETGAA